MRFAVAALALVLGACAPKAPAADNLSALQDIRSHTGGAEVTVEGTVAQVLPNSRTPEGMHERFMLDIHTGEGEEQLILVSHNIDIAPPVPVQSGDDVIVHGVLELDRSGPVIHWTHRDPRLRHEPGYIIFHGQQYG